MKFPISEAGTDERASGASDEEGTDEGASRASDEEAISFPTIKFGLPDTSTASSPEFNFHKYSSGPGVLTAGWLNPTQYV